MSCGLDISQLVLLTLADSVDIEFFQAIDKILCIYQTYDCEPVRLHSIDLHTILVLAKYNGEDQRVLSPQGPLLPGAFCCIMISARFREKVRLRNDPALRHTFNNISMSSRTRHMSLEGVHKIQPLCLFPHGASMGLISQDSSLIQKSRVLCFTTMPYSETSLSKLLQDCVQRDALALSDGMRELLRRMVFAAKIMNAKGLALSHNAFKSAGLKDDATICFPNLSQSLLFPDDKSNTFSQQQQNALTFLNRQNTSMSWAPKNSGKTSAGPGSAGTSEIEFVAHFISDSTVHAIMRNAKQTGKALGLLDEPDQANKGALLKNTEFQKDQRCLAQMLLTALMSGPSQDPPDSISAPAAQNSSQKRVPSTQQMKHIAGCKILKRLLKC